MKNYLLSAILLGLLSLAACKKNEPETDNLNYLQCMNTPMTSKEVLYVLLQGKWILTEEFCSYCADTKATSTKFKNNTLTFRSDSVVRTSDDLIIPAEKFSIVTDSAYPGKFFIQIDEASTSYKLYGYIFVCGDKIGFANGYPSGPTMIFSRVSK